METMRYLSRAMCSDFGDRDSFTRDDIVDMYGNDWSLRSINDAIRELRTEGILKRVPHLGDQRTARYRIIKKGVD